MNHLLSALIIGCGATLFMDLWNLFLRRAFGIPSLDLCLLGRWILHQTAGTFRHNSIAAAAAKPGECALGWCAHYSIGLALSTTFVLATGDWILHPRLLPAVAFGIATVVLPFFVLQPALGLGFASSRAKSPAAARWKSLATHTAFGLGLYLSARTLDLVAQLWR